MTKIKLWVDLDGVLADFDSLAIEVLGDHPRIYEEKYGRTALWDNLNSHGKFFADLDPMSDAFHLWDNVLHLEPTIITGISKRDGGKGAEQKREWVAKHLGPDIPVITCLSSEKSHHIVDGYKNIIIDDWPRYRDKWESRGGHWIHHTNAQESLNELKKLLDVYTL